MTKIDENVFVFKPCKTGAAFQGTLKRNVKLDLSKCEKALNEFGYKTLLKTKDVLIVNSRYNISIFPSCRIIVKGITDEKEAREVVEKIYSILSLI